MVLENYKLVPYRREDHGFYHESQTKFDSSLVLEISRSKAGVLCN